jgi:sugar phosphate permease
VAAVASVRWNGGFLVYAIAFPIFVAMYLTLFEPGANSADEMRRADQDDGSSFPLAAAALVGALTLFSSILYYVFIVNGSIVWRELGLVDPMTVSQVTAVPAMFILAGSVLFRLVSRYANTVQIGTFLALLGLGLTGIGLARSVHATQAALVLQQTGAGMAVPALIAWSQGKFGFRHRGRGMGIWTSAFFLGQAISPIIIGLIAGRIGSMHGAFVVAGAIACLGATGALIARLAASEGFGVGRERSYGS